MKGSEERSLLENALQHRQSTCEEIPIIIDGKEYWTEDVHYQTMVYWLFTPSFHFLTSTTIYTISKGFHSTIHIFLFLTITALQPSEKDCKILLCYTSKEFCYYLSNCSFYSFSINDVTCDNRSYCKKLSTFL